MNFFSFAQIETISPRPLLFIGGEKLSQNISVKMRIRKLPDQKNCLSFPALRTLTFTTGQRI